MNERDKNPTFRIYHNQYWESNEMEKMYQANVQQTDYTRMLNIII